MLLKKRRCLNILQYICSDEENSDYSDDENSDEESNFQLVLGIFWESNFKQLQVVLNNS